MCYLFHRLCLIFSSQQQPEVRLPLGTGIAGHVATTGDDDDGHVVVVLIVLVNVGQCPKGTGIVGHVANTGDDDDGDKDDCEEETDVMIPMILLKSYHFQGSW